MCLQLLAEKGTYYRANASSKVGGMYFLHIAKGNVTNPQESDLHIKYAGKADKSLKDRLDNHGHGMAHMLSIRIQHVLYCQLCMQLLIWHFCGSTKHCCMLE